MQIVNGTGYHNTTDKNVIDWLETSRKQKQKIRIWYGENGKCWNDENDTIGYIGRSNGKIKIPLLIQNCRSRGGSGILDQYIVRIDLKNDTGRICTVYLNNSIKFDHFVFTDIGTVYNETRDKLYARCKNREAGEHLARFMNGERWAK
jgi:hypothetical protein